MLRGLLDVLPILVAFVPVVRGSLLQRSPNADEPVPSSWLRSSELLRFHEGVRCFSRKPEPRVHPCPTLQHCATEDCNWTIPSSRQRCGNN